MPGPIPRLHLKRPGAPKLHFLHANGYPPQAYFPLLDRLAENFEVLAMESRPLWPGESPKTVRDWGCLKQDLIDFLAGQGHDPWLGVGHSVGGTVTLMAALERPEFFRALAILDPPFFSPMYSHVWRWMVRLGLENRLHPLAPGALRRRRTFESRQAMFDNYRRKGVFRKISDKGLQAYVDSLATAAEDGGVRLRYSPDWEARIYTRGMLSDAQTWGLLSTMKIPVIFLRAENTNAFFASTVRRIRKMLPDAEIAEIADATHLFPLEVPGETARRILRFVDKLGMLTT
jgi:pimeloyl-ACP methyl ester carboxylesterase